LRHWRINYGKFADAHWARPIRIGFRRPSNCGDAFLLV